MTKEEAYVLLSFHSCRNNDIENEKWENGFLGSLRPFQGKLYECNFIEIMECLKVLADDFMKPTINQTLLSDVYSIIHDCFYYLLERDVDTAFLEYEEYRIDNKES